MNAGFLTAESGLVSALLPQSSADRLLPADVNCC
jgi:hypothetical protein